MTQNVQQLLLQLDASVELARNEIRSMDPALRGLDAKVADTQKRMQSSFGAIDKAAASAKVALAGFIGALGVSSVIAFGRRILQFADDLGTAADQAGIGVERFQTLQEGLRALEVGSERLPAIFGRLQDALGSVQSGEAAAGTITALERLGALTGILNGDITTTEQLFDAVAAGAKRYTSEAQFLADVSTLVGRKAGVELAAAIRDGGTALAEQEQRFRDAGGVISEEYVKKLADANEEIDKLVTESQQKIAIWTADTIEQLELIGGALGLFEQRLGDGSEAFKLFADAGIAEIFNLATFIRSTLKEIDAISGAVANGPLGRLFGLQSSNLAGEFDRRLKLAGDQRAADRLSTQFPVSRFLPGAGPPPPAPAPDPTGGGGGGGAARPSGPTAAQIRNTATAVSGIDAARLSLSSNISLLPSPEALEGLRVAISEVDIATARIRSEPLFGDRELFIAAGLSEDIAGSIAGAVVFSQNLGDTLSNSFKRAGAALIQSGILRLLGGVGSSLLPGFGSIFGGFRATGGPVSAGRAYVVGERGPEVIIPDSPGTVIPNNRLGGMGGPVTVNVDARGASDPAMVEQAAQRAVLAAAPMLVRAAQAETIGQLRQPALPGQRRF